MLRTTRKLGADSGNRNRHAQVILEPIHETASQIRASVTRGPRLVFGSATAGDTPQNARASATRPNARAARAPSTTKNTARKRNRKGHAPLKLPGNRFRTDGAGPTARTAAASTRQAPRRWWYDDRADPLGGGSGFCFHESDAAGGGSIWTPTAIAATAKPAGSF